MTETSTSTSIVPSTPTVASMLVKLVKGAPLIVREYGLSVSKTATSEELITLFRNMFTADKQTTVRLRFYIGDAYNQIEHRRGERKKVIDALCEAFGPQYDQLTRTYAWVASKWPEHRRNDKAPWNFWVRNHPNGPRPKKEAGAIRLKQLSYETTEEGLLMVCESKGKRQYKILVEHEEPDPAAEARAIENAKWWPEDDEADEFAEGQG